MDTKNAQGAEIGTVVSFVNEAWVATGDLREVAVALKRRLNGDSDAMFFVFDGATSRRVELDLRGSEADILSRLPRPTPPLSAEIAPSAAPGRPRLGVVAREVTLLPRHWDWLASQPGGSSVALRKLVDAARHANADKDRVRLAKESAYRFLTTMAGDRPGFEEVNRALFAGDRERFTALTEGWPADIRDHARRIAAEAFTDAATPSAEAES